MTTSSNAKRTKKTNALLTLLQLDVNLQLFAVAKNGDGYDVADFAAAQGISEIVKVFDGLVAKLNEHITGLESRLCGWRTGLDVGESKGSRRRQD
jgi:hypothetical protein